MPWAWHCTWTSRNALDNFLGAATTRPQVRSELGPSHGASGTHVNVPKTIVSWAF
jgi:hypothetical protein